MSEAGKERSERADESQEKRRVYKQERIEKNNKEVLMDGMGEEMQSTKQNGRGWEELVSQQVLRFLVRLQVQYKQSQYRSYLPSLGGVVRGR